MEYYHVLSASRREFYPDRKLPIRPAIIGMNRCSIPFPRGYSHRKNTLQGLHDCAS